MLSDRIIRVYYWYVWENSLDLEIIENRQRISTKAFCTDISWFSKAYKISYIHKHVVTKTDADIILHKSMNLTVLLEYIDMFSKPDTILPIRLRVEGFVLFYGLLYR